MSDIIPDSLAGYFPDSVSGIIPESVAGMSRNMQQLETRFARFNCFFVNETA